LNEVSRIVRSTRLFKLDKADLILIALSVVLLFFWGSRMSLGYGTIWDTQMTVFQQYVRLGNGLINGNGFYLDPAEPSPAFFGPIYPAYIGLMNKFFDPGQFKLLAINFVALPIVVLLVRRATQKLTGNSILALIVAITLLLWPDFMLAAAKTQPEFLGTALAISGTIVWTIRRGNMTTAIISGVLLGLAALTRSEYLALAGVVSALIWLSRKDLKLGAVTLIAALVVTVPWITYVSVDHQQFVPISVGGGLSLLLGIAQLQDGNEMGVEQSDRWAACCDGRSDLPYWSVDRERHRASRALNIAADNPGWLVSHMWRRWIFWLNNESDVLGNIVGFLGADWFYYAMFFTKLVIIMGFATALIQLGRLKKAARSFPRDLLPILIIPIYLAAIFTPFRIEIRYLTAAWPMIFITLAWILNQSGLIERLTAYIRDRTDRRAAVQRAAVQRTT
jgi:hypothetical protein